MNLLRGRRQPDAQREPARFAPVTIRLARPGDDEGIARVAGRDSRPIPPPPLLVAERDGAIEAVLSLGTGEVVADPFRRTAELVELLRYHAAAGRLAGADRQQARRRARTAGGRLDLGLAGAGGCQ
ncbi:MAG: hypothetical protein ACRDLO_01075 [Solirubrobacterales bacterium]